MQNISHKISLTMLLIITSISQAWSMQPKLDESINTAFEILMYQHINKNNAHNALHKATQDKNFNPINALLLQIVSIQDISPRINEAIDVLVPFLLNTGADVNTHDMLNQTLLHYALYYDRKNIVSILLQHQANPNISSLYNTTPLCIALYFQNFSTARMLINHGAIIRLEDINQATDTSIKIFLEQTRTKQLQQPS